MMKLRLKIPERLKCIFSSHSKSAEDYKPEIHGPLVSFAPPDGAEEVERYWVDEPCAFISIIYNNNEYLYNVIEPELNAFEKLVLEEVHDELRDIISFDIDEIEKLDRCKLIREKTEKACLEYADLNPVSFEKVFYYIKRDFIEFKELSALMRDQFLEDIWCNGVDIPIHVFHKAYGAICTNITIKSEDELNSFAMYLAQQSGYHLSASNPIVDASMRDGSRINITYGREISPKGSSFSIRRFRKKPLTPVDLVAWKTFSSELMAYFWLCVENRKNIIISGGTASGKTASLNALSMFIPSNLRIVTLEDTREIQLPHINWVPMVTRDSTSVDGRGGVDFHYLLRTSLRQRPEYLLVGEVRGEEAQILFQAMNTGHITFSTLHAGSVTEVLNRLTNPPINVPVAMFSALDIICMQGIAYELGGEKRRVKIVAEVTEVSKEIKTKEAFIWNPHKDEFEFKGSKVLEEIRDKHGWSEAELSVELEQRKNFLEKMILRGIRDYEDVSSWINSYRKNPKI
ncbi:MAG: type II/IV secretion system ATPase subunit [Euryarchaeota archaeon]|nr:type II/IV secretion system ATPase subunit [Euryarchaeota archaeon]